jgi:hypothetical protein
MTFLLPVRWIPCDVDSRTFRAFFHSYLARSFNTGLFINNHFEIRLAGEESAHNRIASLTCQIATDHDVPARRQATSHSTIDSPFRSSTFALRRVRAPTTRTTIFEVKMCACRD